MDVLRSHNIVEAVSPNVKKDGQGSMKVTGNVKVRSCTNTGSKLAVTLGSWSPQDVMKESASIAHTYARIKLANYQVLPSVAPVCSRHSTFLKHPLTHEDTFLPNWMDDLFRLTTNFWKSLTFTCTSLKAPRPRCEGFRAIMRCSTVVDAAPNHCILESKLLTSRMDLLRAVQWWRHSLVWSATRIRYSLASLLVDCVLISLSILFVQTLIGARSSCAAKPRNDRRSHVDWSGACCGRHQGEGVHVIDVYVCERWAILIISMP